MPFPGRQCPKKLTLGIYFSLKEEKMNTSITRKYLGWGFTILTLMSVIVGCATPAATTVAPATAAPATSAPAPATAVPATAAPTAMPAPAEIKIGAVVPLTGRYAAGGGQIKNGYELGVEAINKDGGVMVKAFNKKIPLKLTLLDDESDATKTVQRLETLNNDGVVAYLGGFGSDLHIAAAGVAEKNKIPYLGVAFAVQKPHTQGFKYLFSPFPKSPSIAKTLFEMIDTLNPKPAKYAIFAEKTDWGVEMTDLWKKEIQARGFQLVADEQYAPGATDHTSMITKARDGGAEVVLALPSPPDGIAITKQMKELNFNPKLDFFVRAPDTPSWSQGLSKDGDYFLLAPGWNSAVKFKGAAELNAAHQAKYNGPALATTGPAYAQVQILADALGRATKLDRDSVRDAIAATSMDTVVGPVKFNADGTGQVIVILNQWQAGKQELVWPKDQATAPLAYPAKPWKER
jgi:branched-chain amino acid transport system substrate-binding protein